MQRVCTTATYDVRGQAPSSAGNGGEQKDTSLYTHEVGASGGLGVSRRRLTMSVSRGCRAEVPTGDRLASAESLSGDVGHVGDDACDAHLSELDHPFGIIDSPHIDGQTCL